MFPYSQHQTASKMSVQNLQAWFDNSRVIKGISLEIPEKSATAVIGPSGCGKSTFLRCLNRMHEVVPGARVSGSVWLDGQNIYAAGADPVLVRREVGMVFQKPNPFPTMTIKENVLAGHTLQGRKNDASDEVVEQALQQAALWNEVKDILNRPGTGLSGGQQQRLCIARALALQPEVLLMDEPCSALDPIATARVEELINELKRNYTVVIVTHNMQQAARVADYTAFFYMGELIEAATTKQIFSEPSQIRTQEYVSGRFG